MLMLNSSLTAVCAIVVFRSWLWKQLE